MPGLKNCHTAKIPYQYLNHLPVSLAVGPISWFTSLGLLNVDVELRQAS